MPNSFDSPLALLLLLLLPAYVYWYITTYERKRLVIRMSYDPTQLHKPSWVTAWLRWLPLTLQVGALFFFIIALARPQFVHEEAERNTDGLDIMLLLDTSESMEAEDFLPNRLGVAKEQAAKFIKGRFNDRIGVVLFAEEALGYAPLTLDYGFLETLLKRVTSDMLPKRGTAVGDAIAVGINRMEDSKSKNKVMLLITDGVANRGKIDPVTAARLARLERIRIYTIGVGQDEYMAQTDQGARLVKSDLDETTLQKVSELTNGKFFRAKDPRAMERILTDISTLETSEFEDSVYRSATDRYPLFLQIGMILLLVNFALMLTFVSNPLEQ